MQSHRVRVDELYDTLMVKLLCKLVLGNACEKQLDGWSSFECCVISISSVGWKCYWTSLFAMIPFTNCLAKKTHWCRMLGEPPTFSAPLNRHPQKPSGSWAIAIWRWFSFKIHAPLLSLFDGIPQTFSTFMANSDGWIFFFGWFWLWGPLLCNNYSWICGFSLILTRQQLWWIRSSYLGRWLYFSISGRPLVPFSQRGK